MHGPEEFVRHLQNNQYHPRSAAHSDAMCDAVLSDLLDTCSPLAERAHRGELVASLNHTVQVAYQPWNIDLALGPAADAPARPRAGERIRRAVPTVIQLAVEVKGVMTEHGKARKNRLRDLHAFHSHAHSYDERVVAGGIVVVNVSPVFWSPLRHEDDFTLHHDIDRIGRETVELFRNLPLRNDPSDDPGLEAVCVVVVEHDNLGKHPGLPFNAPKPEKSRLVTKAPAPHTGDPLSYGTFIHRLCRAYSERWT